MAAIRSTKYNKDWELTEGLGWLEADSSNAFNARCKYCNKCFKISGSGISEVRSHAKSNAHVKIAKFRENVGNQQTFIKDASGNTVLQRSNFILTNNEKSRKAEILWSLKCCFSNYSFHSNNGNNSLFAAMFPDSDLACKFQMSETKIKYVVQFRIASYLRECLLEDMTKTPFTFLFDETTTAQVKKQYDGYVQYFSKKKEFHSQ